MEVLEPRPLDGGCRWTASPAANTRCFCRWVAYISLLPHRLGAGDLDVQVGHAEEVPDDLDGFLGSSTSGGGWLMS